MRLKSFPNMEMIVIQPNSSVAAIRLFITTAVIFTRWSAPRNHVPSQDWRLQQLRRSSNGKLRTISKASSGIASA